MKLLLALCLLGLAAGSEDYKMFMKWAKTKAMESCWGEDNMKIYTVNMKKAVAKCNQQDAPELDLPPLRGINRLINNLVSMAGHKEDQHGEIEDFQQFLQYYEIAKMMNKDNEPHGNYGNYQKDYSVYQPVDSGRMGPLEKMKMMIMMMKMKEMMDNKEDNYDVQGLNVRKAVYVPTFRRGDKMSDMSSMLRFLQKNKMKDEDESDNYSSMESMFRSMGKMVRLYGNYSICLTPLCSEIQETG